MSSSAISDDSLGKIHHGDYIAGMNALPAGSVDLVFADPPFNIGYDYDVYHDAKEYNDYLTWSRDWISAVHRVLKPDGTFWLAIGDEYAAELKIESQKLGFHTRSWVIWYYTFGVNCKTKFSRSHAHLFHFVKDPKKFTFRAEELENRIPSARLLVYGDSRGNPNGRLPDDTWIIRPQNFADGFTPDDDTWILRPQDLAENFSPEEENWYFPRVAGTFKERAGFHGCQMPEQLLGRIIRICSHEREVVLDPFSGSATTLAVAKKLRRSFVGFDLSPEYVRLGSARLARIRVGDPLDGAPEPTMSAPVTVMSRAEQKTAKQSPLEAISNSSAEQQLVKGREVFLDGLIEAFRRVNEGFSLDRVIADPKLNQKLADECERLGLPGDIRWWNRNLFRARKSGRLANIPVERRTELSWETCDSFLFASEIAWRRLIDKGFESLDDILCDPDAAAEFDRVAGELAPGFTSLDYRWGALKLRKESKRARVEAGLISNGRFRAPFLDTFEVNSLNLRKIPDRSGIYMILGGPKQKALYAGEALSLQSRLKTHFEGAPMQVWRGWASKLQLRFYTAAPRTKLLLANQLLCIRKYAPLLNQTELAAK